MKITKIRMAIFLGFNLSSSRAATLNTHSRYRETKRLFKIGCTFFTSWHFEIQTYYWTMKNIRIKLLTSTHQIKYTVNY